MDEGYKVWLLLMGPAGAGGLYWAIYQNYRNTDKSHAFERETVVEAKPVTGTDVKVRVVRGTHRQRIEGDNADKHRKRVERFSGESG